ncbi:Magnesium transporter MgtE [Thermovenabulum gondwanense]|uniref:Magnesium transporter MgtE n=2 Tax=Thermovenabulum gondwanense TaxID=520767 RepID=A0A162MRS7_9FIRM|nr:magnesium transporter [Thermovenabulum gondwanense]KYO67032.1 Magnesium transporter MgtE [Thermovenabulum gondwanense]
MDIERNKDNFREMFRKKDFMALKEEMSVLPSQDVAEILNQMEAKESLIAFRLLPKDKAADVFSYLSDKIRAAFSKMIEEDELKSLIEDLFFDDKIDFLEEMPANVVKKILKGTPESERRLINQFLQYPEHSAGSIMTIEFVDLKADMTVEEALSHIRYTAPKKETIYTCYVIDNQRHLLGTVSLKDLVVAEPNQKIDDLMDKHIIAVKTDDDREYVASLFKKYDLLSMPVVDRENRLVGIITIDDVVDVLEQENTEDIQRMGGIRPSEESYFNQSPFTMAKNRLLWLFALMVSATFTGRIIQRYEELLQTMVILAAFIPMLMDTGGNAGSQSSTMVIRGLALGEIKSRDALKVMWKELVVSIIVGISLAGLNFLRLIAIEKVNYAIAFVVSTTLIVVVVLAKVVGGLLPLLAKMVKIDPAIMASPLITTIVDAMALISYFKIAGIFLKI